jgi:hypothetical protein
LHQDTHSINITSTVTVQVMGVWDDFALDKTTEDEVDSFKFNFLLPPTSLLFRDAPKTYAKPRNGILKKTTTADGRVLEGPVIFKWPVMGLSRTHPLLKGQAVDEWLKQPTAMSKMLSGDAFRAIHDC